MSASTTVGTGGASVAVVLLCAEDDLRLVKDLVLSTVGLGEVSKAVVSLASSNVSYQTEVR